MRYNIEKLSDNNYLVWYTQLELNKEPKRLGEFVEGPDDSPLDLEGQVIKWKDIR